MDSRERHLELPVNAALPLGVWLVPLRPPTFSKESRANERSEQSAWLQIDSLRGLRSRPSLLPQN